MGNIASKLPNPPNKYRPIPFWSWNERLNEAETRRQIDEMEKAGIGGYFMHARGGLQTPYMQQEWMDNIRAGIEEARERGMGAWAYDENGWPSGFGNGIINGRGEVWQQKYLRYEVVEKNTEGEDGRTIANVTLGDGRILHFYYDVNPFYVDTLDRAVTAAFLEEIYQPYYELFQNDMGRAMPGFFTDEPQVSRNGIPWSLMMIDEYRKTFDEDLVPALPGLFLEVEGYQRTRHRFWWLVQELFVMNFTQQIYDWCEAHGAQLTGHMVLEETLHSQITSNAAVMPHYEFFHMPGMDWLGRSINPITTPLQVASVSHQLGRRQILSETFALTGWNVTFEELKWMFDWQCVRGVTSLCQHLQGYSLRGIRKRDYPPSFFYHEPWWPDFRHFTDMVSRLGMLLAKGDVRYDVLMLHPQQSAWLHYDNEENPGLKELSQSFMAVGQALEAEHVLFHYGDERILRRHGLVEGAKLVVGTQSYSTVVVPPIETLEPSTVALLSAFADGGGQIIWVEQLPTMVNAEPSEALKALTAHGKRVDLTDLNAALASLRVVSIATADGVEIAPITYTKRCVGDFNDQGAAVIYFFANADTEHDYAARIRMQGGSAVRIVLEDGLTSAVVRLQAPLRDVTPGQAAVFYRGDRCLGGGLILRGQVEGEG